MCSTDVFLGFLAILFPPLAVWVKRGLCSADSLINILLCTLGYLPGLFHAWYIIARFPDPDEYDALPPRAVDSERGGVVRYILVQAEPAKHSDDTHGGMSYGTAGPRSANVSAQAGGSSSSGVGAPAPPPPSYDDAVKGDHKVQTEE